MCGVYVFVDGVVVCVVDCYGVVVVEFEYEVFWLVEYEVFVWL